MKKTSLFSASQRLCVVILFSAAAVAAQSIPAPKDVLGFTPGDDRKLASWAQVVDYFQKLDEASDRIMFREIGKTTMGAPFVYATISSPENLKNLEKYKRINVKLADPRTFNSKDAAAKRLIAEGKTIVLITCGIHSTEVGSYLSSMLIAERLAKATDAETLKILENTIILLVPSLNPDGVDIVKNWYDKTLGTKFEGTNPPELYNKYVGHDNNRDWYAFTQKETQLTVDKIHNVWRPQIVNDIHQQGANGARLFLPPYMPPVEPNVPKQIVEGYTELGSYMAADLRKQGFQGITTNSTYDAWTPSRAYSHYHGGVRILSETASAKLATPITVKFEDLRPGLGYDPRKEADNFGPVWRGGEWKLRNITNYMTASAFSLLNNAADNREKWLSRFYAIGKEAVRPRRNGELYGWLYPYIRDCPNCDPPGPSSIPANYGDFDNVEAILRRAGVEVINTKDGKLVKAAQPYGSFAKAMFESQIYPDLRDKNGNPIPPYDVTAHSLSLLMNATVKPVFVPYQYHRPERIGSSGPDYGPCNKKEPSVGLYKSFVPAMDEGWTRSIFDPMYCFPYLSVRNETIQALAETTKLKTIIFADQSPSHILNGYAKGTMPDEYTGGVGKEGVENLRKFVEAGGTLVFLNRASDFAIEQFNLPVRDVTKGLQRKDFYIPGSILRTELDLTSPIAKGMPKESIAWFENSPVFDVEQAVSPSSPANNQSGSAATARTGNLSYKVIARYPADPKKILLSGWALGAEKIAGKAALVEISMGKGKIILFGFRPQYRGQSLATFSLLFNAISQ